MGTPPVTPLASIDGETPGAGDNMQASVFFSENVDDDHDEYSYATADARLANTEADGSDNEIDLVVDLGADVCTGQRRHWCTRPQHQP